MACLSIFYLILFYRGIYAVQLISQPTVSFVVEQGQGVILPFNYTLEQAESASVLTISLHLNDTADNGTIMYYNEFRGDILENRTEGYLVGRPDVQILSSPRTYVGLLIKRTMLSDTGKYIWSIRIGGAKTSDVPIELIVGNKPESVSLVSRDEGGLVYMLTCTVTGGILSPNITILNGTEVIHTSPASTTTINVTVEFPSLFYCVGTNALGSTNKSLALPDPIATMSPSTSPVTTTRDNKVSTTTTPQCKNQTEDNTAKAPGSPGDPPNTALIVGVICGCVGGFFIIAILVCVYKKKGHKTKPVPGKKGLTLEQRVVQSNANTCEQQENTTTLSTQVRRPEKASKLPFIRYINRFKKGNRDAQHTYEVPERVEENQRYTHIALNKSAQELNLNDIELLQNIGHGHFGEVFKAILKTTNAAVAVKLLKEQSTEVEKRDFFREIETMRLVPQHENVVAMVGFCKTAAFLVLEYLGNGNLKTYLRKSRSNNIYGNLHGGSGKLTSQNLLTFALDSAKGMAHIARYKFLHRDLAARNILVSDTMVCKVSDFGLARDVIDSREYLSRMETPLPIRWMAPESISDSVYTTKSDVWSFGVLLWEIVTLGATPYPGITSGRELIRETRSGYRMEKPQHCTQELYNMMMMCWEEEPKKRPTFDNLVTSLRDMANEEMKLHVDVERAAEAVYCDIDSQLVGEIV